MPTLNKLEYLDETKQEIKEALNTNFNSGITDSDTFRSYVSKISDIYTNWHKVTGTGTDLELTPTKKGKLAITPKGNSSQFSTEGYQMLDLTKYPYSATETVFNGATVTVNGGMITVDTRNASATATIKSYSPSNDNRIILPAGTYYFSIRTNGYLIDGETSTFQQITEGIRTLEKPYKITQWYYPILTGYVVTFPLLISNNSSKTSYEPYTGGIALPNPDYPQNVKSVTGENVLVISNSDNTDTQTFTISLGSIELCKIGDYQDYIYKSGDNWYKKQLIGKVVLDGSETYTSMGWGSGKYAYRTSVDNLKIISSLNENANIISNCFISYSQNALANLTVPNYGIGARVNQSEIIIRNDDTTSIQALKTWLSTHNTTAYYALATSTDIPITDTTLITQLNNIYNNIHSYDGTTNVTSTYADGNEQMIIDASALMKGGN